MVFWLFFFFISQFVGLFVSYSLICVGGAILLLIYFKREKIESWVCKEVGEDLGGIGRRNDQNILYEKNHFN